ncbi:phospholipase [Agrobacterium vitis]|nr:phospholipase [Allorhizobium ampelinum]
MCAAQSEALAQILKTGEGAVVAQSTSTEKANPDRVERARRLVIFFHGIRSRGSVMEAIGDSWSSVLPDTEFVSPDAPFTNSARGREWFIVDNQVMRPDRIEAARRAFDDLVSAIVKREGFQHDLKNVAFVGVSQGAIVALDAVTRGRWKVGALVSFAGLLPLPPTSSSRDTAILLMHGGADRTIPSAASVAAESQLKAAGYDVTYKLFPGVGHTISSEEAEQAAVFLRKRLAD